MNEPIIGKGARIAKRSVTLIVICALVSVGAIYFICSSPKRPELLSKVSLEESQFHKFLRTYKKSYEDKLEYQHRLAVFKENLSYIHSVNSEGLPFTLGVNRFADMSFAEFKASYLLSKWQRPARTSEVEDSSEELVSISDEIDWRSKGAVNPIRDQGQCGSCWAFSAIASVESAAAIKGYGLHKYSEQQLIDCDTEYNAGCNGGLEYWSFEYLMDHGTRLRSDYPYEEYQDTCKENMYEPDVFLSGFVMVPPNSKSAMLKAIAKTTISIGVEADRNWSFYASGVLTADCGTSLNHSVNVVGYDLSASPPYYIIRNSWSEDWGEKGYIRIEIEDGVGKCGTNMDPSYPFL